MDGRCADGARVLLPTRWRSAIAERRGLIDQPAHGGTEDDAAVSMMLVFLSAGTGDDGSEMDQFRGQQTDSCRGKCSQGGSEEHTSELQKLMRTSKAISCWN